MDFETLDEAIGAIEALVRDFEPGILDAHGAARAVKRFARLRHLGECGGALAAKRVADTRAHRESGARGAADWYARTAGIPLMSAERALDTAELMHEQPEVDEAFRAGRLSEGQASEISAAVQRDPNAAHELLSEARRGLTMKGLKDRCRRVRAMAEGDDEAWKQRLHDSRQLRRWTDGDSSACGSWRLSHDKGAEINAALDAEIDVLFREARRGGVGQVSRDALAADALHALVTRGPRKATCASLIVDGVLTDSGEIDIGSRCELAGIGPIPRALAREMLKKSSLRTLPADPDLLPDYSSPDRKYPAWMLDWLDAQYPTCGQPGCDADFRLEIDHVIAIEDGGLTAIINVWKLCPHHHRLKHQQGWRVVGEPHQWELVPPDGPDPP